MSLIDKCQICHAIIILSSSASIQTLMLLDHDQYCIVKGQEAVQTEREFGPIPIINA